MNKLMPYLLVMAFGVIITVRLGYVALEYYGHNFVVQAQETSEKTKKDSALLNKTGKIDQKEPESINDRILKKNNNDTKKNIFSEKTARNSDVKNPKQACITGGMLKDALEKLAFLLEQQRLLEISDRRVREQVAKLKLIKNEIIESAQLADSSIAKENKRLISIYEKMKPKDAANIFNEMQPNIAAELLRTMKEDQSSQILSKMNPKNAHDVTLSLAGGIKKTEQKYDDLRKTAE
jgi:flagellar motility protein MotE (MotC chaperone)